MMGTQGHGILEDALIGSTARRVIRRSKKPVLVVRLPDEDLTRNEKHIYICKFKIYALYRISRPEHQRFGQYLKALKI